MDLSDRQAARNCSWWIDWKYVLGLERDPSFWLFSTICEFRAQLISGGAGNSTRYFTRTNLKSVDGLLSRETAVLTLPHVRNTVLALNRLETVGETLRAAQSHYQYWPRLVTHLGFPRTGLNAMEVPVDEYRLPKGIPARQAYALIGLDGMPDYW